MIDADAAEKAAHEACPCRLEPPSGAGSEKLCRFHDYDPTGNWPGCKCIAGGTIACYWPGHAAIRALRSAAYRAGLETAAKVAENTTVRCSDCGGQNEHDVCESAGPVEIAAAIRSLAAKEASDGK